MLEKILYTVGTIAALGVAYFIWRVIKSASELMDWVDKAPYTLIAKRLHISEETFFEQLRTNRAETLAKCATVFQAGTWHFTRKPDSASQIDAQVSLQFADGNTSSMQLTMHWDELPSIIRSEFIKTGEKSFSIKWVLPKI